MFLKVGKGGGQTYPKILDQPKNIKKSLEQFSSVGGGGGGVVPKTSISISMAISLNSLYFFLKCGRPTPSLFKFLFSHIKFKKNVCCEKKGAPPPPLTRCYVPGLFNFSIYSRIMLKDFSMFLNNAL